MKQYTELTLHCPSEEHSEIATAFLADYPFETFDTETSDEEWLLHGYILSDEWRDIRDEALASVADYATHIEERDIEDRNWNAEWEAASLARVDVDDIMVIRPAHCPPPAEKSVIDIIVAPQMSFGSGQHHTTRLMCRLIHRHTEGGRMLDVGCGTGVLSITALKCGAEHATAIDIDPWSVESTRNAAQLNALEERITPILGTVEAIEGESYTLIAANIMRNILIEDMARYNAALRSGGKLLLSGYLEEDYGAVRAAAEQQGLVEIEVLNSDGWIATAYMKQ